MRFLALAAFTFLFTVALAAAIFPATAFGADNPFQVAAGGNGAWLTGPGAAFPVDLELGGAASVSASPHISGVGSLWYGVTHAYLRWAGGARYTITDTENKDFNMFLGLLYRGGSTAATQPQEWAPDAGFGWRPDPAHWPRVVVVGEASIGNTSHRTEAILGVRYSIPLN